MQPESKEFFPISDGEIQRLLRAEVIPCGAQAWFKQGVLKYMAFMVIQMQSSKLFSADKCAFIRYQFPSKRPFTLEITTLLEHWLSTSGNPKDGLKDCLRKWAYNCGPEEVKELKQFVRCRLKMARKVAGWEYGKGLRYD